MEKHDLHKEFTEYDHKITDLKASDKHFKKMYEEYTKVNKEIHGIETTGVFTDEELNQLRLKRVQLKNSIISSLQN